MKKTAPLVVVALMFFSSIAAWAQGTGRVTGEQLMRQWIAALRSEDINGYASCYWPEATLLSYNTNGDSKLLEQVEAIRRNQKMLFDNFDFASMNLTYANPRRIESGSGSREIFVYDNREHNGYIEMFYLEKRSGEFRIVNQVLVMGL